MWWHGRGNSGGSWLPEDKKANMWHRRGNIGGSWPPAFPRSSQFTSHVFKYLFEKVCLLSLISSLIKGNWAVILQYVV